MGVQVYNFICQAVLRYYLVATSVSKKVSQEFDFSNALSGNNKVESKAPADVASVDRRHCENKISLNAEKT